MARSRIASAAAAGPRRRKAIPRIREIQGSSDPSDAAAGVGDADEDAVVVAVAVADDVGADAVRESRKVSGGESPEMWKWDPSTPRRRRR